MCVLCPCFLLLSLFCETRLEEVQATRDALTEEVTSLGRRNTELQALASAVPSLREQVKSNVNKTRGNNDNSEPKQQHPDYSNCYFVV